MRWVPYKDPYYVSLDIIAEERLDEGLIALFSSVLSGTSFMPF